MNHAQQRHAVLQRIYEARTEHPRAGWLLEHELRAALGDIDFALAVLAELGHLKADGHKYRITGAGVLACEMQQG